MARTYSIDAALQLAHPAKRPCDCGCTRPTHTYIDHKGQVRETRYAKECYDRKASRRTGRPPGRPRLPEHQRRNKRVVVRLTNEEYQRLCDLGARLETPVSVLFLALVEKFLLEPERLHLAAVAGHRAITQGIGS